MYALPAPRQNKRGSVLLVAVILGTGIALALGSFVAATLNSTKLSYRSFHANSTLNLAEGGLEWAIWSLNHADWSGWTTEGSNNLRTLSGFDLGNGTMGEIKVIVYGAATSSTPRVVAQGRVSPAMGPDVVKQVEVRLNRRSLWATGIVSKDSITFSGGNAAVDSYISSDPNFSTAGLYDPAKRRDRGTAGSVSVTTDAISISNSDIWGYVATGGSDPQAGPNGTILGADSPAGVKIDPARVSKDFTANFDLVTPPATVGTLLTNVSGNYTFGAAGSATTYTATSLANTNGRTIEVVGDVTLVVSGSVDIKGALVVRPDSSLTLYVGGDFEAGGTGAVNQTGLPENLVIYGTDTVPGRRKIFLHGNGILHAAVYAPNASLELKGGGSSGEMCGSVVANNVKITGNYAFHYDEALETLNDGNPFSVGRWRELISMVERVAL